MNMRPFPEALKELLKDHDISLRELGRRVKRHNGPHLSMLGYVARGDQPPSERTMVSVAKALQIEPEFFPEYRLRKAREALDPEVVGLKQALKNLGE